MQRLRLLNRNERNCPNVYVLANFDVGLLADDCVQFDSLSLELRELIEKMDCYNVTNPLIQNWMAGMSDSAVKMELNRQGITRAWLKSVGFERQGRGGDWRKVTTYKKK